MRRILTTFPYLLDEAALTRARIELLKDEMYSVCITASLSGMPFCGQTSDSTARAAVLIEEREEMASEVEVLQKKAEHLEALHLNILSTLRILTDPEREAVWARSINPVRKSWAEIARTTEPKRSIRWWQMQYNTGISRFKDLEDPGDLTEELPVIDGWRS